MRLGFERMRQLSQQSLSRNWRNRVVLGARKILVYKEVHGFFETTLNCSSSPLYKFFTVDRFSAD